MSARCVHEKMTKIYQTCLRSRLKVLIFFETDAPQKKERIVERDVPRTKSDVDRQLQQCRKACPSDCESCGAKKIEELQQKLTEYKGNVEELVTILQKLFLPAEGFEPLFSG